MRAMIRIASLLVMASAGLAPAAAVDLRSLEPAALRALQERLRDAQCYTGETDGTASAATEAALKRCPVMDPVLTIETGMHTAQIAQIGVDRACRLLATGSPDKTVRLWSLPEGRLLKTLRPPTGPGDGGKIFALALSPDGKTVAAGGADAHAAVLQSVGVYLFDTASGKLNARLGNFDNKIVKLAFSPDGRFLAVTLNKGGLRVFEVAGQREVAADRDYGDDSYGLAFAPDGRLFTASNDGFLRGYDRDFRLVKKAKARVPRPFGAAIDPAGDRMAVAHDGTLLVEVYRTADLGFAFAANMGGMHGADLITPAWSADGRTLAAGGGYNRATNTATHMPVVLWDQGGRGPPREEPVASETIQQIVSCGEGFAVGSAGPQFALLNRSGRPLLSHAGVIADMRNKAGAGFRVSSDGLRVRFGLRFGELSPIVFDLTRGIMDADTTTGLAVPKITGIRVTDWQNGTAPKLAGKPLALKPFETSRALAIAPDGRRFVIGAESSLRAFDPQGHELWNQTVPETAWGVNVTPDGRRLVVAYGDGTIRWHRMSDGQELLALFINRDDRRWVAWTPSGYYMASPGAEDMIGWHVNRGWDQAADFFPASRFRERFNRPDVVRRVIETLDEAKALEEANRQANIRYETAAITARLPPVVTILSPRDGDTLQKTDVTVEYEVRSPSGLPVDGVEVLIDGRPTRGFKPPGAAGSGARTERQSVTLPARDVELGLMARSGSLASTVATVRLKWAPAAAAAPAAPDDALKPKLYGVVIGVSAYQDTSLNLLYAAKDARDFAAAIQSQKGGIYRDVEVRLLTDDKATTLDVKRALTWLEGAVTSRDVGIVFMAGHGQVDAKNRFYYLTADTKLDDIPDTAFEGTTLRERTRSVAGKMLVFLDTCYAGKAMISASRGVADINSIVNELASTENGIVTYASSTGREVSQENETWGNGAFTKALIEGLGLNGKSRADITGKGVITTAALDLWVSERVKELTGGSQHPVMIRPETVPDFPMFVAKH